MAVRPVVQPPAQLLRFSELSFFLGKGLSLSSLYVFAAAWNSLSFLGKAFLFSWKLAKPVRPYWASFLVAISLLFSLSFRTHLESVFPIRPSQFDR